MAAFVGDETKGQLCIAILHHRHIHLLTVGVGSIAADDNLDTGCFGQVLPINGKRTGNGSVGTIHLILLFIDSKEKPPPKGNGFPQGCVPDSEVESVSSSGGLLALLPFNQILNAREFHYLTCRCRCRCRDGFRFDRRIDYANLLLYLLHRLLCCWQRCLSFYL